MSVYVDDRTQLGGLVVRTSLGHNEYAVEFRDTRARMENGT
jgi:hypothetical protein